MTIDDVAPSADTVLTAELRRLFLAADCDPACHACGKKIKVGSVFKLVPHRLPKGLTDEMCCAGCGEPDLLKRDARNVKANKLTVHSRRSGWAGYSRPSKVAAPGSEPDFY